MKLTLSEQNCCPGNSWYPVTVTFAFFVFKECKLRTRQMNRHWSNRGMETSVQFSSVQSLSRVRLFVTPWISAHQASLSITNSWSSLRLMSTESVMASSHLILCHPLLLLPPIPPSIRVFSNESTLRMRCPKYRSFSCSIILSKEIPGVVLTRILAWEIQLRLQELFSKDCLQKHC